MFARGYTLELSTADYEEDIGVPSFYNLAGVKSLLFFFALVLQSRNRIIKAHMHTWVNTCSHVNRYACIHTHIHECVNLCIHMLDNLCFHAFTPTCIDWHTQTCRYVCIHVCMYISMLSHTHIHDFMCVCINACIPVCDFELIY